MMDEMREIYKDTSVQEIINKQTYLNDYLKRTFEYLNDDHIFEDIEIINGDQKIVINHKDIENNLKINFTFGLNI